MDGLRNEKVVLDSGQSGDSGYKPGDSGPEGPEYPDNPTPKLKDSRSRI